MGVAISHWLLAKTVSQAGQLGVVSGTCLDNILIRRLQDGDPEGHMRRALSRFPEPAIARKIVMKYFREGGLPPGKEYALAPMFSLKPPLELLELTVAANFVEVFLAKEGHEGVVGINYLEKIQAPLLASLYGALLAEVDYVCVGAGIPRAIPGILDKLANHEPVSMPLFVVGSKPEDDFRLKFDPAQILKGFKPRLKRPFFIAIVASNVLAVNLAKKSSGRVDGFVVEGPLAGGHNAPPRGSLKLDEKGEPVYGPRDEVDLEEIRALGLPFWVAGSMADPEKLEYALKKGACGIQVGTAFAFCRESGMEEGLKASLLKKAAHKDVSVFTDPNASPTGFPFKIVQMKGTLSEQSVYDERPRICDLGYLRTAFRREDGSVGFRCPGEPVSTYLQKGGKIEDTPGRRCLCNSLHANVGMGQTQKNGFKESCLVTAGDDLIRIGRFLKDTFANYSALDVIRYLLSTQAVA